MVVWAWSRDAVRLKFDDFVTWYDDWWYPASDDVWVLDVGCRWLVELDHEEVVRERQLDEHQSD